VEWHEFVDDIHCMLSGTRRTFGNFSYLFSFKIFKMTIGPTQAVSLKRSDTKESWRRRHRNETRNRSGWILWRRALKMPQVI